MKYLVFLFVFSVSLIAQSKDKSNSVFVGTEAPTFSLPDMNQQYFSLGDFCGKKLRKPWKNKTKHVVVLSFFATWCKPCKEELPHLMKLRNQFKKEKIKFFLIDVGEKAELVKKFLEKYEIDIPVLLDQYQKTAEKYDALTLPRLFVIDKNGIIRKEQKGFTNAGQFEDEMQILLSGLIKSD